MFGPKHKAEFLAKILCTWADGLKDVSTRAKTLADMDQSIKTLWTMVGSDADLTKALKTLKEWREQAQTDPEAMSAKIAEYGQYWVQKAKDIK
jgi:type I site-specific restriction endonuclease